MNDTVLEFGNKRSILPYSIGIPLKVVGEAPISMLSP